ncbi:hypothetical protein HPB49_002936 [Dermacentor silvarum]|uniref:Uncharacterized protein n=1 Tax=Dermacentor silvarum TaxID=543639 RepID=A0ACB8CPB5_DERSI|nr:hypothetical protein HPB49_002936 [Dermacentor silvarum]
MVVNPTPLLRRQPAIRSSLMTRSYRLHARLCRLCGCFFVRGLYDGDDQETPRVVWKSWYTLYSLCCLTFLLWVELEDLVPDASKTVAFRGEVDACIRFSTHSVLLFRSVLNFISLSWTSSKIIDFYDRASKFEKSITMLSRGFGAPKRFFWADVHRLSLCVIFCAVFTLAPPYPTDEEPLGDSTSDVLMEAWFWSKSLISGLFYFVYDSIYFVSLTPSSKVLQMYLNTQLQLLQECTDLQSNVSVTHLDASRRLEDIRLNLFIIRKLKEDMNDIWRWPLVVSAFCVLLVPCNYLHEIYVHDTAWRQRLGMVLYSLWFAYEITVLSSTSQSLLNTLRYLHASIDPEAMSLKGADFFELKMSLPVSIAAALITYGVILIQTTQVFNGPHCGNITSVVAEA